MTQEERKQRILARGEFSNHCHVITGDIKFDGTKIIIGEDSNAVLKHLLEKEWIDGKEVWTGEHKDMKLLPGIYNTIQQQNFDPLTQRIINIQD